MGSVDFDAILTDVGEYGKYQKFVLWFILLPATLPCGFNAYNQLFMTTIPEHWCKVPELGSMDKKVVRNLSIPLEMKDGSYQFSRCHMYKKNYSKILDSGLLESSLDFASNDPMVRCENGWHFEEHKNLKSIISEVLD